MRTGDTIHDYLRLMAEKEASDLFCSVGAPVHIKVDGKVEPLDGLALAPGSVRDMAYSIMTESQIRDFESNREMNLAISIGEFGRFRVNVYFQRSEIAMVVRYIRSEIPSIESLGLPPVLKTLIMEKRGLILVAGASGSGKSTTLASMIDYRNANQSGHILCIEDPIEFLHRHRKCVIDQREVGIDTNSFENALKNALREAPDVIMIGEILDRLTMQHAIAYAETGHLCISTLHSNNASQAIDRIVNFFPEEARAQLLLDLSLNLRGVISQRLVPSRSGGLLPALEVMLGTPYVSELIRRGSLEEIRTAMSRSTDPGVCTFDQSLFDLYSADSIRLEDALAHADSATDLRLRIRLSNGPVRKKD